MKKLSVILLILPAVCFSQKPNIELSRHFLYAAITDSIVYSFYLPEDANTTIKFVNIYGGGELSYEENQSRNRGWQQIVIKSDSMRIGGHSSGVYYIDLIAEANGKTLFQFNSFAEPWGQTVEVLDPELESNSGMISYTLPKTCFVKARIGFSNGSLLRTLINLKPQARGKNSLMWDGLDQSQTVEINDELDPKALIIAYAIPETTFYLKNDNKPIDLTGKAAYPEKWSKYALNPYAGTEWNSSLDVPLAFEIFANQDTTLTFDFPAQSEDFNQIFSSENEIYISVDNEYIVENPNVMIPGNYSISFPPLSRGKHVAIVNIILPESRIATGTTEFFID